MPVKSDSGLRLVEKLQAESTTVCRCWKIERSDGVVFGFTDHDGNLTFGGVEFRANSGMTARSLVQTTGLAVDNTEAVGALSDTAITEADIQIGRFDDATVEAWVVDWTDTRSRLLEFSGSIGEVTQRGGQFEAELRGLSEGLNRPVGRVYQRPCPAILGDEKCRFNLDSAGYSVEAVLSEVEGARVLKFSDVTGFDKNWFERGSAKIINGPATGLIGIIKSDRMEDGLRIIELWQGLRVTLEVGDRVRLNAGCDKLPDTCREKFNNFINFRGFPHIPGEDWLTTYPKSSDNNDGGSAYQNDSADW